MAVRPGSRYTPENSNLRGGPGLDVLRMETNRAGKLEARLPVEAILKEAKLRHLKGSHRDLPGLVVVGRKTPLGEVVERMREARCGSALVAEEDGTLAGIFTERDYLDKVAVAGEGAAGNGRGLETKVEELMTSSPRTLSPDHTLRDAIRLMTEGGYRHIPLVETGGKVFGLVAARDLVVFIAEHFPAEVYNLPPRLHQRIRTKEGG
jgi:CBS domain-containing protein